MRVLYYTDIMSPRDRVLTFRPDPEVVAAMTALFERDGIGFSEQLRRALRPWLEAKGVLPRPSPSDPYRVDDENPEWTAEDFARARPAGEVFPELFKAATPKVADKKSARKTSAARTARKRAGTRKRA